MKALPRQLRVRSRTLGILPFGFALALLTVTAPHEARAQATRFVNPVTGVDLANNCLATGSPCKTITNAIGQANPAGGDTISLVAGTYNFNANPALGETFPLTINKSLNITGPGATISAAGTNQSVIIINSGTVTISGVTITGGNIGVLSYGTLILNSSTVSGNTGYTGAGMYIFSGTAILNNSTVSGNQAQSSAGGIRNNAGTLTLNDSNVSGNTAGNDTAGIMNNSGLTILNRSTVSVNHAMGSNGHIGGIRNDSGTVTLNNSTVSGNIADGSGGGIANSFYVGGGTMILDNSTVSRNISNGGSGGGIFNGSGIVQLKNSIIADNGTSPNCTGTMTSLGYNLSNDGSCITLASVGDKPNTAANLSALQNNGGPPLPNGVPTLTHLPSLLPLSQAINGVAAGCTFATDQRGVTRPQPAFCDIGAVEVEATSLQVTKMLQGPKIGTAWATYQFDIYVNCTPSGLNALVSLIPGGSQIVPDIPVGSACTIMEKPPLLPPAGYPSNCTWATTLQIDGVLQPGVQPPTGFTFASIPAQPNPHIVEVINTITCPSLLTTSLNVQKSIVYPPWMFTGMPPTQVLALVSTFNALPFNVDVNCLGATPPTVTVTAAQGAPVINIPVGSACTITEQVTSQPSPPAPYSSCTWGTPQLSFDNNQPVANGSQISNIQQTQGGNNVAVINKLDCPTTSLQVTKLLQGPKIGTAWATYQFDIYVNCTPGPNTLASLVYTGSQTVPNILVGSSCTIMEKPPLLPPAGYPPNCTWATTLQIDGVLQPGVQPPTGFTFANIPAQPNPHTVEVINTITCPPPATGQLNVSKQVVVPGNAVLPFPSSGTPFSVTTNCGTLQPLFNNGPAQTVPNIPFNSSCQFTETLVASPPKICPAGLVPVWVSTTYGPSNPVTVTVANSPVNVVVTNTMDCVKAGSLTLRKIINPDPLHIAGTPHSFTFQVQCTTPPPANQTSSQNVSAAVNIIGTISGLPLGAKCTAIQEILTPPLPSGCTWNQPTISPSLITIVPGVNVVVVTNSYAC